MPRFEQRVSDAAVRQVMERVEAGELTKPEAAAEIGLSRTQYWRRSKALAAESRYDSNPKPKLPRSRQLERVRKQDSGRRPEHKPFRQQEPDLRVDVSTVGEPVITRSMRHKGGAGDYSFVGAGKPGELGHFGFAGRRPYDSEAQWAEDRAGRLTARQKDASGRVVRTSYIDPSEREFYESHGYSVSP